MNHASDAAQPSGARELLSRALARYRSGEYRARVLHDLVQTSIQSLTDRPKTILDIGCGHGFDGNEKLQQSIAEQATHFIGVEPDTEIETPPYFHEIHRCTFEQAYLKPESVQVAYSAFVLEHLIEPELFWNKLHDCLAPGGVFWGFTVDARHPFCLASRLLESLKLKDRYLSRLRGERGSERYENYSTYYRANTPGKIRRDTKAFNKADFLSMHRVGQLDYYTPRPLRGLVQLAERLSIALRLPGSVLAFQLQK